MSNRTLPYKIEKLPVIMPYHRRSDNVLSVGELVYYGPSPEFYGIGEIVSMIEDYCVVDFRGTGALGIHKDAFDSRYLIPIHQYQLEHVLLER